MPVETTNSEVRGPACGYRGIWQSYFCGRCEEHFDGLYIAEHADPARAHLMNRADIIEEYHMAGIPFSAHHARVRR